MTPTDGDPLHRPVVLQVGNTPGPPRWDRRVASALGPAVVYAVLVLGSVGGALAGTALLDSGDPAIGVTRQEAGPGGG